MADGAPSGVAAEPAAGAAATKAAAMAALRALGASADPSGAASLLKIKGDGLLSAGAARDKQPLPSSASDLHGALWDVLAARAHLAKAEWEEARKIQLLTEMLQDPNGWSEENIAAAALSGGGCGGTGRGGGADVVGDGG